jgi:chromate reductase
MPLPSPACNAVKIHISNINKEFDEKGDLMLEDTFRFTDEQMDKFIKF